MTTIEDFAKLAGMSSRIVLQEFREMIARMHEAWPEVSLQFEDQSLKTTLTRGIENTARNFVAVGGGVGS